MKIFIAFRKDGRYLGIVHALKALFSARAVICGVMLLWIAITPASAVTKKCEPFALTDVRLLPSRFLDNMRRDSAWMMSIPVDQLLHSFRTSAGAFSGREGGYMTMKKMGGWESLDCDLRGHITGHILSALAALYAQTGSKDVKDKSDSIIDGLSGVQKAYGTSGYLAAFPEGLIDRNIQGKSVWAPFYTLHKIAQGLIDQYTLCRNDTALALACRMGLWAFDKLKPLSETTRRAMIRNEFGGFGDAMYQLYEITADKRYLWVARFFYHNDKVDPLKAGEGNADLGTNHANTFIPKLIAEARNYEIFGNDSSRRASERLFSSLAYSHAFVTGEVSDREHLFHPADKAKHLTGYDGENCCTFNLLKLADHVFAWNGEARVADFYERALYNHILGGQDPMTSMVCYFTPLLTGAYRLYSTRDSSYWCCVGSGFESHVKYASSIYFHSADGLWVNLFIPSEVVWDSTTIRQETTFPLSGVTTLTIGGRRRCFTLHLRHPAWATSMTVKINGKKVKKADKKGSCYVDVKRAWKAGDKVEISYGMTLSEEPVTADNPSLRALLYGPVVLAGKLDSVCRPFSDPTKYNDYYTYDYNVPNDLVSKISNAFRKATDLQLVENAASLRFRTPSGIDVVPFYDAHHCRYVVYWPMP